jgi:glycosyltransferase involved in cell wall biosynthesis
MTVGALSPFGRGTKAPLAGRTILQIVPPLNAGGDERSTLAVAAALIEVGARALVASDPGELASETQALGGLHLPFPSSTKNPFAMALNARRLARLLESERVDLVHARSRAAAWVARAARRRTQSALVTTILADGAAAPGRTRFESALMDGDLVIVSSQYAADRAARVLASVAPRLRIVRPGLYLAPLAPEGINRERVAKARHGWGAAPHERIVLAPTRLGPARGQRTLIEAAALLRERGLNDIRFVLAGETPKAAFARELDALGSERGVRSAVTRADAIADRPAAMLAASVVVFPTSEAEGVTRATIEAAASGALTIISDVGPGREVIAAPPYAGAEERTGWLPPPGDAAALAAAIGEALTLGASAREAIRRRARARIAELYSLERMTRDTLTVYEETLNR